VRIQYGNGPVRDAQIFSLRGNKMRLGLKNSDDAVELHLVKGKWVSQEGDRVTFGFPLGGSNPLPA
jgi:hypothetical protein